MAKNNEFSIFIAPTCVLILIITIIWTYVNFVSPIVSVWQEGKRGEAELRHAEYNRQIAVCEAEARMESARHLAEAEIIRSMGVAKANKIIGDSLEKNEAYLRYLWIQGLQSHASQVVYIPTEANLPILESSRLR